MTGFRFLIVPGAWHQPQAFEKLVDGWRKLGYSATVPGLPSCDAHDPRKASCSADAQAVREQILHSIDVDDDDVVVVAYSYGDIPAGGAAHGLSKIARGKKGKRSGVVGMVYVSGFVVPEKSSLLDVMGGHHAPYVDPDQPSHELCTIKDARDVLYDDLDDSEAQRLIKLLRPTSMHALDSHAPPAAWAEPEFAGKLTYIRYMQDQALPPFLQDSFVEKSGVAWNKLDLEASHSPFASKPDDLSRILGIFADFAQHFDR